MKKALFVTILMQTCFVAVGQTPKSFKWIAWKNVTVAQKTELKKIVHWKEKTAYDNIIETLEYSCTVSIAILDMDGDGKMEYAVRSEEGGCCGYLGCTLVVYRDKGLKRILLTDQLDAVKPARNGVISSKGRLIRFE